MPRLILAALASATLIGMTPAHAQQAGEKINQLIIYGDDPCPQSSADEITVCARKDEGERYRIPPGLRSTDSPQNVAWTQRVKSYETVGKFGMGSCSPSGAGGWVGCANKLIDQAYAEKRASSDVHFRELIAAEHAKREATTDANAAEMQRRVEEAERAYEARQRAQAEAEAAAKENPTSTVKQPITSAPPPPVRAPTPLAKPPSDDDDIAAPLPATVK